MSIVCCLGANTNAVCHRKTTQNTPLHLAAIAGKVETVTILLGGKNTVNVSAEDVFKDTPLHKAAEYGHVQVADLLLHQK